MNKKIKSLLRVYLGLKLRLCKRYMREQDFTAAKMVWQQAIGAVEFTSMGIFDIYYDEDFSAEIDTMWEADFRKAFEKTLYPEVGE